MKELEEGELEEETSDVDFSVGDWQNQTSTRKSRLEKPRDKLEECQTLDEKGVFREIEPQREALKSRNESLFEEKEGNMRHFQASKTKQGQSFDLDAISTREGQHSDDDWKLPEKPKTVHQTGFQEEKDQWICEPEVKIFWHGKKVSVKKAASDLPDELFAAFEEVLDELLQQSCFGGVRCNSLMDAYKEKLPASAREFKRIARFNNCSSTTLVKLCLWRLNDEFKVFPKRCWNGDGNQSSDAAVIRRKEPRRMLEEAVEENKECNKEVIVIAKKVSGTVKWFDAKLGYGFITRNDNKEEVFVYQNALIQNNPEKVSLPIEGGESVVLDVLIREKRIEAFNVSRCEETPVMSPCVADQRKVLVRQGRETNGREATPGRIQGFNKDKTCNEGSARLTRGFRLSRHDSNEGEGSRSGIKSTARNEESKRDGSSGNVGSIKNQSSGRHKESRASRSTERKRGRSKTRKRNRSGSSRSERQKGRKGTRKERSKSNSSVGFSSSGGMRKESSRTESRSRNSRRERGKSETRLKGNPREKRSDQLKQNDAVFDGPIKKKGALVADTVEQRVVTEIHESVSISMTESTLRKPPASPGPSLQQIQKPLAQFGLDPSLIPCKSEYQEMAGANVDDVKPNPVKMEKDHSLVKKEKDHCLIKKEKDPDRNADLKLSLIKEETDPDGSDALVPMPLSSLKTEPTKSFPSSLSASHLSSAEHCQQDLNMEDIQPHKEKEENETNTSACRVYKPISPSTTKTANSNSNPEAVRKATIDNPKPCPERDLNRNAYLVIKPISSLITEDTLSPLSTSSLAIGYNEDTDSDTELLSSPDQSDDEFINDSSSHSQLSSALPVRNQEIKSGHISSSKSAQLWGQTRRTRQLFQSILSY